MVAQTVKPLKWVIVSDGSIDGTDEIVNKYTAKHDWIELIRMPERRERNFAGKVQAFNAGRARLGDLSYDIIGNLDADVSFEAEHFQYLITKFIKNQRLGVVGTPFLEESHAYDYRFTNIENVWGGCQLFRRECFEDIGGYLPVRGGCVDHIAVVSGRIRGWKTRTFTEKVCLHHRKMGTAQYGGFRAKFRNGAKDYSVGNHPVWELFRTLYQMTQRPLVLGGLAQGLGYVWSMVRRMERPVSREFVAFTRREQMERLSRFLKHNAMAQAAESSVEGDLGSKG
jgi:glycosyltransferase involved in cell wall biosynthesis